MTTDLRSDHDLAERARRGDAAAWRVIYDSTCDRLFAFLCYQIGDREEARDVLQETYLQAFRRLETYRGEAPIGVWLRSIALGRSIDWKRVFLRRLRRTTRLEAPDARVESETRGVQFAAERDALYRALRKLSRHQRSALLLREWEGLSFREIAQVLHCAESTARVHHTRARERMRAHLAGGTRPLVEGGWEGQET